MDNQHRKITNYRELEQHEIDLMNKIKDFEKQVIELGKEVEELNENSDYELVCDSRAETWTATARTQLDLGFMSLVRAVAKPIVK